MRRILLAVTMAIVVAAMLAVMAAPAFAQEVPESPGSQGAQGLGTAALKVNTTSLALTNIGSVITEFEMPGGGGFQTG